MANLDLQSFIEDRLRALDPTIDVSSGSPAQELFIQPLLTKLGTDPFETDIQSFILDRLQQEYPDIFAGDPGAVNDLLVKPLILLLTPFKREIQTTRLGQSLQDPSVLSDEDADALVANIFDTRDSGGFASGVARVYFPNPTTQQFQLTNKFYTTDGLNFFPSSPVGVTAEEMVFNREGSLFFAEISVRAENAGDQYNIDVGRLVGVVGVFGQVKVSNPQKFTDGSTEIDTPTFVAEAQQSLTERSLVTRRGGTARLLQVFQSEAQAVQVIGAGDEEMQRDLLVAESDGHAWLSGIVAIYDKVAMVQCSMVDSSSATPVPLPGDTLFIYLSSYAFASLPASRRYARLRVENVIVGPLSTTSFPYEVAYLVQWSDPNGALTGITGILPLSTFSGGFEKASDIQISSLPDIGSVDLSVPNGAVHVLGHTDIYVRPVLQNVTSSVFRSVVDDPGVSSFKLQGLNLQTFGATAGLANKVTDSHVDFTMTGVPVGAVITIETGADAGTYNIGRVSGHDLYLTVNLSNNDSQSGDGSIRYRVSTSVNVNPFEPKIPKIPFGTVPNNDLQTTIGLSTVKFNGPLTDVSTFGAEIGDTLRILTGIDIGDYSITGLVDGKNITLNKSLSSSASNLSYEIFTPMQAVQLPLVRLKSLQVLDSSSQSTGVEVPYGLPVAVVPTSDFSTAQVRGQSQARSGFVIPQLLDSVFDLVINGNVAATSGDRRYSMGFDPAGSGIYKAMGFADSTQAELLFQPDALTGCNYFMATCEDNSYAENLPPIEPKPGEVLTLKSGPNAGSYVIQDVYKFKYSDATSKTFWVYFIRIFGSFPVDILRQLANFVTSNGGSFPRVDTTTGQTVAFPDFFVNSYNDLGTILHGVLATLGVTAPTAQELQLAVAELLSVDYEWGDPARGVLRSYFLQPTLFQQNTALSPTPTTYSFKTPTGEVLRFRANPFIYESQVLVPPRLSSDFLLQDLPRDIVTAPSTGVVSFSDSSRPPMFSLGIQTGDSLSIYPEQLFHGSSGVSGDRQTAVQTQSGSTTIRAPGVASGTIFTQQMVGNLVCIDQGPDLGEYTVASVPDSGTLVLDRPLSVNTPTILSQGDGANWGYDGTKDYLQTPSPAGFSSSLIGLFLTIYGIDSRYQGSYAISAVPDASTVVLTRTTAVGHFPSFPQTAGRWVITDAPAAVPVATTSGTVLCGLQSIRVYDDVPQINEVSAVPTDLSSSSVTLASSSLPLGVEMPFQITRSNVRNITPADMAANAENSLVYFDTEVVSLGCQEPFNLVQNSYLSVEDGTYECLGYHHLVDDFTLSYSMKESGTLSLPLRLLSASSPNSAENYLSLLNTPLQVNYEFGDIVAKVQAFLDSPDDRTSSANMLARHFLPAYASYDASYVGGSAPSVIAQDIVGYLNTLPIETPVDVSYLEDLIDKRGGNPRTPTQIVLNVHDWDRRMWVEFSKDEVGGTKSSVPYNGSPRVTYVIPGPDYSGQDPVPAGERINLTQM